MKPPPPQQKAAAGAPGAAAPGGLGMLKVADFDADMLKDASRLTPQPSAEFPFGTSHLAAKAAEAKISTKAGLTPAALEERARVVRAVWPP